MRPIAEIFSQGEEVITGQIVDSNAAWLSTQLDELGFSVRRHTAVGDRLPDLVALFNDIAERADCCICTGGLGPTVDDLTAEAAALASGQALVFDPQALAQIEAFYRRRQRQMPETNRKQAYLPAQAQRIDNPVGTAPGFAFRFKRCWFVCLPGVPREMHTLFQDWVLVQLQQRFALHPDRLVTLRCVGLGESAIQQALHDWQLPESVNLGFRCALQEVQTKLRFPAGFSDAAIATITQQAAERIGTAVFAIEGLGPEQGDLLAVIHTAMRQQARSLVVVESVSHGSLAARCLGCDWLLQATILPFASSSTEVSMSEQQQILQHRYPDSLCLLQYTNASLTELRDPHTSVILQIRLYDGARLHTHDAVLAGSLDYKQQQAATLSLDLLRRYLQNLCL